MTQRRGYIIADQYATCFVTLTLVGWVDLFTRQECKDIMIESLKYCIQKKGLVIYAYVIMSNHVHLMVSAQEEPDGLSALMELCKLYLIGYCDDFIGLNIKSQIT